MPRPRLPQFLHWGMRTGRTTVPARAFRERPRPVWNDGVVAEDTWLRDRLALERTALANERTLLAYVRTGLALVVAAAAAIHFLESLWVTAIAWGCVVAGLFVLVYGLVRFRVVSGLIHTASRRLPPTDRAGNPGTGGG